jgi:hypothetical protein
MGQHVGAWLGAGLALFSCASCAAQRILNISSEPAGALVLLDDQVVGTTPYQLAFEAYGTRRVTLYHAGYRTSSRVVELVPPWYARFPIDLISEVLIPVGWKDIHTEDFQLEPESGEVTEPDLQAVLERAESLRRATPEGPRDMNPAPTPKPIDPDSP